MNHTIPASVIRDTIAALEWAQQNLGKHTRPSPIDHALPDLKAAIQGQPEPANPTHLQALQAVKQWYETDGSVGACSTVMELVDAALGPIPT